MLSGPIVDHESVKGKNSQFLDAVHVNEWLHRDHAPALYAKLNILFGGDISPPEYDEFDTRTRTHTDTDTDTGERHNDLPILQDEQDEQDEQDQSKEQSQLLLSVGVPSGSCAVRPHPQRHSYAQPPNQNQNVRGRSPELVGIHLEEQDLYVSGGSLSLSRSMGRFDLHSPSPLTLVVLC